MGLIIGKILGMIILVNIQIMIMGNMHLLHYLKNSPNLARFYPELYDGVRVVEHAYK